MLKDARAGLRYADERALQLWHEHHPAALWRRAVRDGRRAGHAAHAVFQFEENVPRARQQGFAGLGEGNAAADAVKAIHTDHGRLDILVNNAGILRDKSFKKMSEDLWDPVIEVHLKGTYHPTRAAYAHMLEQGGGSILHTSSVAGLVSLDRATAYCAAKAGVIGMTRTWALELAEKGITFPKLTMFRYSILSSVVFLLFIIKFKIQFCRRSCVKENNT